MARVKSIGRRQKPGFSLKSVVDRQGFRFKNPVSLLPVRQS
ncbi:hypothetical protein AVDCRST_MAG84-7021 [uncultured Microcoleus sp.]|uniref:Uncharacterized protein n=1 Tax=uncultured Microcoleus sp. TaxID=259945 RepID=A0A6J4PKQ2_9CYAN|nr:hypothetical protein AVDCRST_MAG84-7021 [uncultured Microcoleus sp.]